MLWNFYVFKYGSCEIYEYSLRLFLVDVLWFFILRNKMVMNMFDYLNKFKGII